MNNKIVLAVVVHSNKLVNLKKYVKNKKEKVNFEVMFISNRLYFIDSETRKILKIGVCDVLLNNLINLVSQKIKIDIENLKLNLDYNSVYRVFIFYENNFMDSIPLPYNEKLRVEKIKELKLRFNKNEEN
jgi:septum formation topological specificity factor MinE